MLIPNFMPTCASHVCLFRFGTFVRLGFANVDRSFIEIDLVRNFHIRPYSDPAASRCVAAMVLGG